ncbi:SLC13 family permease [Pararhodospirillum photometricum]|uniref:Membrane anion transport protein n=1 Tax=Pararhodospirillum photometricum DSM 122 TaxID=1150469 RepID=H6SKS4_PARPM|nr:SLC13 family permease [Pararhodospirillum photometricum]CCG08589.1 Membrane anion transport protein [Pararhodospirillum photometricum DSM 122]
MSVFVVGVFIVTYLGMALGRIPGLGVDRVGIALLAAIALEVVAPRPASALVAAIDFETLGILFGLMVVSLQFSGSGFHDWCAYRLAHARLRPLALLALIVGVTGGLSALLTNDVIVLALTPILAQGLRERGLDPRPYLLALAGAANAGSAATVIGNPQNILIAQKGALALGPFLAACAPPALMALVVVWAVVAVVWRRSLRPSDTPPPAVAAPLVHPWGLTKGLLAIAVMLALFLTPLDRATAALVAAGLVLTSRSLHTREVLGHVDWPLLVLFTGLFVVVDALAATGLPAQALAWGVAHGLDPQAPAAVLGLTVLGSNTIGNVPLITLWLAVVPERTPEVLHQLSVYATLAGNLLLIGSLANLIVADQAARVGVRLGFWEHARCGIPMTLGSLVLAWLWFALR